MCEPCHNVTQWPDRPSGPFGSAGKKSGLRKTVWGWIKKLGDFCHASVLGDGHRGVALRVQALKQDGYSLPFTCQPTGYEGTWWQREFHRDGGIFIPNGDALWTPKEIEDYKKKAEDVARLYHEQVCFGTIQNFRRFLERTLIATNKLHLYWHVLNDMFNAEGKLVLRRAVKRAVPRFHPPSTPYLQKGEQGRERFIAAVMGVTRKRKLFIPEFSDDSALWTPGQRG